MRTQTHVTKSWLLKVILTHFKFHAHGMLVAQCRSMHTCSTHWQREVMLHLIAALEGSLT